MKKVIILLVFVSVGLFGQKSSQIESLLKKANTCYNTNVDSVGINLQLAYAISNKSNNYDDKISVIKSLLKYSASIKKMEMGNKYFKEGIELAESKKDIKSVADLLTDVSMLYKNAGFLDQSVKFLLEASKIYDSLHVKSEMVNVYRILSHNFSLKSDNNMAYEYALKSLKAASELRDIPLLALANSDVASALAMFENSNKSDSAIIYFKKSISFYEKLNDIYSLIIVNSNFGLMYQRKEKYAEAEVLFLKSYKLSNKLHSIATQVCLEMELGCLYTSMKQYDKAKTFLDLALSKEKTVNQAGVTQDLLQSTYIFYKETGNSGEALNYFEKFVALSDSLNRINNDQRVMEVETKFRTKEKQKEIEVLNSENKIKSLEVDKKNQTVNYLVVIASFTLLVLVVIGYGYTRKKKANSELQSKNKIIEEKNHEIQDSINYAQKIQETILPRNVDDEHKFILFQPKDIVSGDFYWHKKVGDKMYIAAADCTGHGVPGALMSIINNEILNSALNEHGLPCNILSHANDNLLNRMAETQRQDGMDIGMIMYDEKQKVLMYSGAKRPLYLVRNGVLTEYKGTKFSIGGDTPYGSEFEMNTIQAEEGDCFYVTTDGFVDQFGGTNNKKYSTKKFKDFILSLSALTTHEQRESLKNEIKNWKGTTEQTDDICVVGIKI